MAGTAAVIEARMASSRLPGKVLLQVNGKPLLIHLIRRLQQVSELDTIVVATTTHSSDDAIENAIRPLGGVECFRGSGDDVLTRVLEAALSTKASTIVEVTGDCPLLDPEIVAQCIRLFRNNRCDYASNVEVRTFPDGMDVQVFSTASLATSSAMTSDALHREHVSLHMRRNPDTFVPLHLVAPPNLHWPELGLTLDEFDDLRLIEAILREFGPSNLDYTCLDIVTLLRQHPDWLEINSKVKRKGDI